MTCQHCLQVWEKFARRKDRLRERRTYPTKDAVLVSLPLGTECTLLVLLCIRADKEAAEAAHSGFFHGLP